VRPRTRHPIPSFRARSALLALVAGAVVALSLAGSASAATPCGKRVLGDWFDNGRIDKIYPLNCYEEAIDAIPNDIRDYADAEDVITRALQAALHGNLARGGTDPSKVNNNGGSNGGNNGDSSPPQAAPPVDTSNPSAVPIPLLVLGGLSLALLAAGALGYLSRRGQATQAEGDEDDFGPQS